MGKRRPRYPCVDGRIVDVDARDAVWIAAADGPELALNLNHREMVPHPGHLCPEPPVLAGGVDQHSTRAATSADDKQPSVVRHHAVTPAGLDHGRKSLPRVGAGAQSPEIVVRRPILMTEMGSRNIGSAADIELVAEPRRCEMVARSRQLRSR